MDQREVTAHDDRETGHDLPNADGQVSDDEVKSIDEEAEGKGGQDHSLEDYDETMPESGVGAVQDSSNTTSDVARIDDEK